MGKAYIAGAVRLFAGDDAYLPLYDGSPVTVASIGAADVRSHAIGGGRAQRRPGLEATPTVPNARADTRLCSGVVSGDAGSFGSCGRDVRTEIAPHWILQGEGAPSRRFFEMAWTRPGAVGGLRFDRPLDLTSDRLELRTIVDPRAGAVDLQVRVTDGNGASATLDPEGGRVVEPLLTAQYLTKLWAQPVLVDATGATGVDLADIRSVELVGGGARGRVWVTDLAAAPAALAAVPDVRLPQVNLGDLELVEGDPAGDQEEARRVARVPFTIAGEVTRPSRFVVVTAGQELGSQHRFTIEVAPGQTSGTIPVAYSVDRLDDYDAQTILSVWPVSGLTTDDYLGTLSISDDDPSPQVRVTTRAVREGGRIVFRVSLSGPVGYDSSANLEVVKGPGEDLRAADVPRPWLKRILGDDIVPNRPLWRSGIYVGGEIRAGKRTVDLVIPTRTDRRREGVERLTVRLYVGNERVRRTVTVRDAR